MKKIIITLLCIIPSIVAAQGNQSTGIAYDKIRDSEKFNPAFEKLVRLWTLGLDSSAAYPVDLNMYNDLRELFLENARVTNHADVKYQPADSLDNRPYKADTVQLFDDFLHDAAYHFRNYNVDTLATWPPRIDGDTLIVQVGRKVNVAIPRTFVIADITTLMKRLKSWRKIFEYRQSGWLGGKSYALTDSTYNKILDTLKVDFRENSEKIIYHFEIKDTVLVKMLLVRNDSCIECESGVDTVFKIVRIDGSFFGSQIICLNDSDIDAVVTDTLKFIKDRDYAPKEKGDFTGQGRPDYDFDYVIDREDKCIDLIGSKDNCGCPSNFFLNNLSFEGHLGLQENFLSLVTPDVSEIGYYDGQGNPAVDVLQSHNGTTSGPDNYVSLMGGASLNYYFGREEKNTGMSFGLNYTTFAVSYKVEDPIVYTYKSFDGYDYYRRRVTI